MDKRSSKKKPTKKKRWPSDPAQRARAILEEAIGGPLAETEESDEPSEKEKGKNPAAVALGRLGGLKGGKARADKLSEERRREIAQKAARARWKKKKKQ